MKPKTRSTAIFLLAAAASLALQTTAQASEIKNVFAQEVRTEFFEETGLPGNDIRGIAILENERVAVATATSVAVWDGKAWTVAAQPPFAPEHFAASIDAFHIADTQRVAALRGGQWHILPPLEDAEILTLHANPASPGYLIGTSNGLYAEADGALAPLPSPRVPIHAIAHGPNGELALGTDTALYLRHMGQPDWTELSPENEQYRWAPRNVRAVAFSASGSLYFGAEQGVGTWDGASWQLYTGKEGLPYNAFRGAVPGESDGVVWFATGRGAIRFEDGHFAYRCGKRWLPAAQVNAIGVQANGTAWIATPQGLSRIERRAMNLAEKAAYFTKQSEERHVRDGFVLDCRLKERYQPDTWAPKISDNDGMYTALYGAAQAFRYTATGDAEAHDLAKRSFDACKRLVDITGTGMPARVIIPADWHEPVNEQYGAQYNTNKQKTDPFWKLITPRFPATEDGKYLWKCDTSSDELAGHYFFYGIYYDLVADAEEKKRVAETVRAVTDHLVDNGFLLRDHDGEPTRWGDFSPEFLNSVRGWDQRGLNSMMMLSFLKVAEHVTGDAKYAEAAKLLRDKHNYHANAMHSKEFFPPGNVVPWDNNLCLLSWYGLIRYEDDPELMLRWRWSVQHAWAHISPQKNALWNLLYQACAQRFDEMAAEDAFKEAYPELGPYKDAALRGFSQYDPRINDTLETLRGIPLDLIGYHMDNRHRIDIIFDPTPNAAGQRSGQANAKGWHYDGRALPVEERGHVRQDRDAFALNASEDAGWAEHEGTFFLLPYWLAVHHGFIE